jgi:hypothetical protein
MALTWGIIGTSHLHTPLWHRQQGKLVPTSVALGAVEGITMLNLNPYKLFIIVSAPRTMVVYPLGSLEPHFQAGVTNPRDLQWDWGNSCWGGELRILGTGWFTNHSLRVMVYPSRSQPIRHKAIAEDLEDGDGLLQCLEMRYMAKRVGFWAKSCGFYHWKFVNFKLWAFYYILNSQKNAPSWEITMVR